MNKKAIISVILCCLCVLMTGCRSLRDEMKSFPVLSEPVPEELQGTDSMEDIRFEPYSEGVFIPHAVIFGKNIRWDDEMFDREKKVAYLIEHGLETDTRLDIKPGRLRLFLYCNTLEVTEEAFLFWRDEYKKVLPLLMPDLPADVESVTPVYEEEHQAITEFIICLKKAWDIDDPKYAELRDQLMVVSEHYNNDFLRAEQTLPLHLVCKNTKTGEMYFEEAIPGGTERYIIPYDVFLPDGWDPEKLTAVECREIAKAYGLRSFRPRTEAIEEYSWDKFRYVLLVQMTPAVREELIRRYRAAVDQDIKACMDEAEDPWIRDIQAVADADSDLISLEVFADAETLGKLRSDPWRRAPLKQLLRDAQLYNGFVSGEAFDTLSAYGFLYSTTYVNTCFIDADTNQRLPELYPQETVETRTRPTQGTYVPTFVD